MKVKHFKSEQIKISPQAYRLHGENAYLYSTGICKAQNVASSGVNLFQMFDKCIYGQ